MKFGRPALLLLIGLQIACLLPTSPRVFDVIGLLTGASLYWMLRPRDLALLVRETVQSTSAASARF